MPALLRNRKSSYPSQLILLLPVLGMVFFIIFYLIAAINYTGGSYKIPAATHFNFWNNYLCDLLDPKTYNATVNTSRHYAQAALGVLCLSIMVLWLYMPRLFNLKKLNSFILQFSGIFSMITTLFLSSKGHDLVVRIAGVLGFIAIVSLIKALINSRNYKLAVGGCFCLLILALNYIIYESGVYIAALPVIQKFTFVSFMAWFGLLNIALYLHIRKIRNK